MTTPRSAAMTSVSAARQCANSKGGEFFDRAKLP
jgi:hypothetical protein